VASARVREHFGRNKAYILVPDCKELTESFTLDASKNPALLILIVVAQSLIPGGDKHEIF
jgi:hypothetical protein